MKTPKLLPAALAVTAACFAVETKFWQQGDRTDFEKGSLTHLSLRSDGRIFLAPEFPEVFDSSTPYLWAVAADSKGNLYTAGGGSGSGSAKVSNSRWMASPPRRQSFSAFCPLAVHRANDQGRPG